MKKQQKKGVIQTIVEMLINTKKPLSKKQILANLKKRFPERNPESMLKTINTQISSRIRTDRKLNVEKSEKGFMIIGEVIL